MCLVVQRKRRLAFFEEECSAHARHKPVRVGAAVNRQFGRPLASCVRTIRCFFAANAAWVS